MDRIQKNRVHPVIQSEKRIGPRTYESEHLRSWRERFVEAPGSLQRNGRAASGPEQTDAPKKP